MKIDKTLIFIGLGFTIISLDIIINGRIPDFLYGMEIQDKKMQIIAGGAPLLFGLYCVYLSFQKKK